MNFLEYIDFVEQNWKIPRKNSTRQKGSEDYENLIELFIMAVGLAGEAGEAADLIKKYVRDGELDKTKLALELGDVFYYVLKNCNRFDISPHDMMRLNKIKLELRQEFGKQEDEISLIKKKFEEIKQRI